MNPRSAPSETRSSGLLDAYDGLICDLDGVVQRGRAAVPGAPASLNEAVARGRRVVFATNNASRHPSDVAALLRQLGVAAGESDVVTSAQAGAAHLRTALGAGARVIALGGPGVTAALTEQDLVPVGPGQGQAGAILQGYGPSLTVADFADAARLLASGTIWVATNADLTLPLEWGPGPGNGAYVALLASVANRQPDATVGKPARPLYDLAIDRLGVDPSRVLAVGDRLDTDIDGAAAAGVDSAWVLTGVHAPSDLVASADRAVPTYVIASLAELFEPYAAAHRSGDGWACGASRCELAILPGGEVRLVAETMVAPHGGREPAPPEAPAAIEALRAGLAALLEARNEARVPLESLVHAARSLDAMGSDASR